MLPGYWIFASMGVALGWRVVFQDGGKDSGMGVLFVCVGMALMLTPCVRIINAFRVRSSPSSHREKAREIIHDAIIRRHPLSKKSTATGQASRGTAPHGYRSHIWAISKQECERVDVAGVEELLRSVIDQIKATDGQYKTWTLTISGYDGDPRHLAQIPEVRNWCKAVHSRFMFLPSIMDDPKWYVLSIADAKAMHGATKASVNFEVDVSDVRNIVLHSATAFGVHLFTHGVDKDLATRISKTSHERLKRVFGLA